MSDPTRPTMALQPTRLAPPRIGRGWIPRPRLVDALAGAEAERLLLLDAPVGYGKSALLAEWRAAEEGRRPFVWLPLEEADSDPSRLFTELTRSIGHFPASRAAPHGGIAVTEATVRRLADELATVPDRLVIVLDDYHRLRGKRVHHLMRTFLEHLPAAITLAIATRADPPLPLGRLRAEGAMLEIRAEDLRFNVDEATALLRTSGVELGPDDVVSLVDRTEGWPAALYLAILSLRSEADPGGFVRRFAGTHRNVADYLSEEVLSRLPNDTRRFLVRTSILERMCGSLCDHVQETHGSQTRLEELERSNLLIVPLDDDRVWYRYHHLFAEMLRADLARTEPELAAAGHRRASDWHEAQGLQEEAVHHALAAGELARAVDLIVRHWFGQFAAGRLETVRRWLEALGEEAVDSHPAAALVAGWVAALLGQPQQMERWLDVAERAAPDGPVPDGTASLASGVAIVRGLFGFRGLRERRADLDRALELEPDHSRWVPLILWAEGHSAKLSGDPQTAVRTLEGALLRTPESDHMTQLIALSTLSTAKTELGHLEEAMDLARRADAIVDAWGLQTDARASGVPLALGCALVARGDLRAGRDALERALELRRSPGRLSPWTTLEVLTALAPARLTQGDRDGAKELLREARAILLDLHDAGDIPRRLEETGRLLERSSREVGSGDTLTEREISVLRLLPTHLSQREIGAELYVSVNTVKTHSRSIYRKLRVSTRTQAVERARELGLLPVSSELSRESSVANLPA